MPFARPYFKKASFSGQPRDAAAQPAYYPDQVCKAYGFPANVSTTGRAVGIVELGGQCYPSDLAAFCQERDLPLPAVTVVPVNGASITADPGGADVEVMFDVENAAAAFPGCPIRVYFADNTEAGFLAAVQQAVQECDTVSISWGAPEDQWSASGMQAMNAAMAAKPTCASSGDSGSTDGERGKHVDFPASSPNAIACGGTTLPSLTDLSQETAWSDSGGGISTVFAKPAYQSAVTQSASNRCSPDCAANADPNTPYNIFVNGAWMQVGGTSGVAPLMAGLLAAIKSQNGGRLPDVHGLLYASGNCRDVVSGSNGAYAAGPGYDLVTGCGVPIPVRLGGVVAPPPVSPAPPVSPPPVSPPPVQSPAPVTTIMADLDGGFAAAIRDAGTSTVQVRILQTVQKNLDSLLPPVLTAVSTLENAFGELQAIDNADPFLALARLTRAGRLNARLKQRALPPGTLLTIIQTLLQDAPTIIADIEQIIAAIKGGS